MSRTSFIYIAFSLLFFFGELTTTNAQFVSCPPNIGFEDGSFNKWECSSGTMERTGEKNLAVTGPYYDRHTIITKGTNPTKDFYGDFPIVSPNGSNKVIKLGNDQIGGETERVSYTFTVPAGLASYSIIFNYAVVFQDFGHASHEQPKFTVEVFDVTSYEYITCSSFEFIASSGLPGFEQSTRDRLVFYKDWSPVTLNLNGYSGKTVRLEFTTNDCSLGGHFGYAYIDIDENCASPISGSVYCPGTSSLTLKGPNGFNGYKWSTADFSTTLGTSSSLYMSPPPPNGTRIALELLPFPGLGCRDTVYTTIDAMVDSFNLIVKDTITACENFGVNLRSPEVTAGSTPNLKFAYFTDSLLTNKITKPDSIMTSGSYYIHASNTMGCNDARKLYVHINPLPDLQTRDTVGACYPSTFDLSDPTVILRSDPDLTYTYWKDPEATIAVTDPTAIKTTGNYFIKGSNSNGCFSIRKVFVLISGLNIHPPSKCDFVDLTIPAITTGSTNGLKLSYWQDVSASMAITNPKQIKFSGTYYIKALSLTGCEIVSPVIVTIFPAAEFDIVQPAPVVYPAKIDLYAVTTGVPGNRYFYYTDSLATKRLDQPGKLASSGTYYIKGVNTDGCSVTKSVRVDILPPDHVSIKAPNAFTPNGDGINDVFSFQTTGVLKIDNITIYNRWGQVIKRSAQQTFEWDGRAADGSILPYGMYYWIFEGSDMYRKTKLRATGSIMIIK